MCYEMTPLANLQPCGGFGFYLESNASVFLWFTVPLKVWSLLPPPSLHFSHSGLMAFPGSCHTGSCLKVFAIVAPSRAELSFFFSMSPAVFDLYAYRILINCRLLGGLPWPLRHSLTSIRTYFVIAFTFP